MVYLAASAEHGGLISLRSIAEGTDSPVAFTAKILQKLVHAGLVHSIKGPGGGFSIPTALLKEVKLSDVVKAIDGDVIYTGCALGLAECDNERPCPLHDRFLRVREDLRKMLESTRVCDLVQGVRSGDTHFRH